jgi:class 3 adenylate cyclase/tetratricopeptide (TPR) repeat protein
MPCGSCGLANEDGARFCAQCGVPLVDGLTCISCGAFNHRSHAFCSACGAPAGANRSAAAGGGFGELPAHIAAQLQAARNPPTGEHKQVTVLFVDVKGSMGLSEDLDVEQWYSIMGRFFETLSDGVHRFEGRVDRFTGDGVMAVFGAPLAYEDHARRAAHAALHLQAELASYTSELAHTPGLELSVRMGLNSGEVVVGSIGDDLSLEYAAIGRTAGLAQRMEALARSGTIAVSENTAKLISGYFQLGELGMFDVKGARARLRVYELLGHGQLQTALQLARTRGFSRFVGRTRELDALAEALERARSGDGRVIAISGEAGIGKSRLVWEFLERCRVEAVSVWEAHGLAHARALSFTPILELLRDYFAILDGDQPADAREKIRARLSGLALDLDTELPLLFDFLGLVDASRPAPRIDPEARQRRLFAAVNRVLAAQSEHAPTVLLVEDLHWLDQGSAAFLQSLVAGAEGTRTLLLVTFRPEHASSWTTPTHGEELALSALEDSASESLLSDLLGVHPSLDGLSQLIVGRADGNPFFCEELVSSLVESGFLAGTRGSYRLRRALDEIALPATVQATLAARIDRLGADQKQLLQVASVIGYQVAEQLLHAVAGLGDDALQDALRSLVAAELLIERDGEQESEYSFKHPLTHEVAYRSQLSDQRRRVHRQVATVLEQLHPDRLDERAALVAQHWEAAGELLEAARWNARAARWVGVNDIAQAGMHWQKVGELVAQLPRSPASTTLEFDAHFWQLNYGWRLSMPATEAAVHYQAGTALAHASGNAGGLLLITAVYATRQALTGRIKEHIALAEDVNRLSRELGDPAVRLVALPSPMLSLFLQGRLQDALELAQEGVAIGADDHTLGGGIALLACPYAYCVMFTGWFLCLMGRLEESAASLEHALEAARAQVDLEVETWTEGIQVVLARYAGASEATLAHATHGYETATRIGSPFSRVWSLFLLGEAHLLSGGADEAVAAIEGAIALGREVGIALEFEALRVARLSEALLSAGDPSRALASAEEAVSLALERGTVIALPACYQALAEALLVVGGAAHIALADAALDSALEAVLATGARAELPFIERSRQKLTSLR